VLPEHVRSAQVGSKFGSNSMVQDVKGLEPDGPRSWSVVNLLLPLKVGGENPTEMFALAYWVLPRVPTIGEEIYAIGHRITVERVGWDIKGKVTVRLREAHVEASTLRALEQEGWTVAPWEDEPPSEWLTDR
jgi:hypothetical protein